MPGRDPPEREADMYVDVHCHLLPGVDDGAADWAESSAMLTQAREEKVSALCVTPHMWPDRYPNRPGDLREAFRAWSEKASGRGIELHLGGEVHFRPDLAEAWSAGDLLPLGERAAYVLVELPLLLCPPGVEEVLYRLRLAGAEPVLAHPERYPYAQRDPGRLSGIAEAGIPFQLTCASVAGHFGSAVQKASFAFLERGWVHVMASDAHSPTGRRPVFREAVEVVVRRYGREAARRLCVANPRRLLDGEAVQPVLCAVRKRGLWRS